MESPVLGSSVSQEYIFTLNLSLKKVRLWIFAFVACLTLLFLSGTTTTVKAQTADSLNASIVGSQVLTVFVQPNGKILIGGDFTSVLGVARNNIARLNADGTLDTAFNPNASGTVTTIAVQSDGQVLAGGSFTAIGGLSRNSIARLDAVTGAPDPNFDPNATIPVTNNAVVFSIKVQTDGKILVGGFFTAIGGSSRNHIARLLSTGAVDTTFNPNANGEVRSIVVQADGIIIGGVFDSVGGQPHSKIARLSTGGTPDDKFNPNANDNILSIALQADGKILVGGDFITINGQTRNSIARLNADGTLDNSFNPDANNSVLSIVVQPDGKILVGGFFTNISEQSRNFIARLLSTGAVDTTFNPSADRDVYSLALQTDNKVLVGGIFTNIGGLPRNLFARLNNTVATAATVSGRVIIRGRGLARAQVMISDSNGMIQKTMTNPLGFYRFENVVIGSTYIFEVKSKRYTFAPQVVTVSESISDLNFTGQ